MTNNDNQLIENAEDYIKQHREVFIHSFIRSRENVSQVKAHFGDRIELNIIIKDFTKNFEQLHDNVGDVDKYLPVVYTKGELEELL